MPCGAGGSARPLLTQRLPGPEPRGGVSQRPLVAGEPRGEEGQVPGSPSPRLPTPLPSEGPRGTAARGVGSPPRSPPFPQSCQEAFARVSVQKWPRGDPTPDPQSDRGAAGPCLSPPPTHSCAESTGHPGNHRFRYPLTAEYMFETSCVRDQDDPDTWPRSGWSA